MLIVSTKEQIKYCFASGHRQLTESTNNSEELAASLSDCVYPEERRRFLRQLLGNDMPAPCGGLIGRAAPSSCEPLPPSEPFSAFEAGPVIVSKLPPQIGLAKWRCFNAGCTTSCLCFWHPQLRTHNDCARALVAMQIEARLPKDLPKTGHVAFLRTLCEPSFGVSYLYFNVGFIEIK